jgi:anthranilate synthase/aminodeoxychorismate synthase-like glutamine amidotransferase
VQRFHREIPLLGVCLGHQAIGAAFGAKVIRAPQPVHGRTSEIHHDECGVFTGLPNPLTVCRYHSLIVDEASLPAELLVSARTSDGIVMALAHREWPVVGVQFHPEAVLTQCGYDLLRNFLEIAGIGVDPSVITAEASLLPALDTWPEIETPITF